MSYSPVDGTLGQIKSRLSRTDTTANAVSAGVALLFPSPVSEAF